MDYEELLKYPPATEKRRNLLHLFSADTPTEFYRRNIWCLSKNNGTIISVQTCQNRDKKA